MTRLTGPCEKSRQLDVSPPLTSAAGHRLCLYLGGCAEEVRELLYSPIMSLVGARVSSAGLLMTVLTECALLIRMHCRSFHQSKHWARTVHSARDPESWRQDAFPYMGEEFLNWKDSSPFLSVLCV